MVSTKFKKGHIPWNKGVPRTEEEKNKISKSNIGKKGYWKGKHLSEITKQKMSETRKRLFSDGILNNHI